MKKIALFPGSFDPFTNGHYDIVNRGLLIFDQIIIAIGHNTTKKRYFEVAKIASELKKVFAHKPQISVTTYEELTTDVAKKHNATFLLRGLRNSTDFEYEKSIDQINKDLYPELETVFLMTKPENMAISSTIVRELHKFGADITKYVPISFT